MTAYERARAAIAILALCEAACAEAPPKVETATIEPRASEPARPYAEPESAWGKIRSLRFHLHVPVPDRPEWKVDDASRAELVATHAATKSSLVVSLETESSLMNRQRCEARARELGHVPKGSLQTIDDLVTVGPDAYDTRVWVAVEAPHEAAANGAHEEPLVGHVFAFGAYVRKCLFVHLTSEVASARDEPILSQRLALARVRTVGGLSFDNFQDVPRAKEGPERH